MVQTYKPDAELEQLHPPYVEMLRLEQVYINKPMSELHHNAHNTGMTLDEKLREAQLNTAHANGTKNVFVQQTSNARLVEMITANSIKWYNIGGMGGNEHYSCDIEHTVTMIKVAAVVVDTLVSCRETMPRAGIIELMKHRLNEIVAEEEATTIHTISDSDNNAKVTYAPGMRGRPRASICQSHVDT